MRRSWAKSTIKWLMLSLTLALSERRKAGAIVTLHGGGHRDEGQWGWQPDTHPAPTAPEHPRGHPPWLGGGWELVGRGGTGVPYLSLICLAALRAQRKKRRKQKSR